MFSQNHESKAEYTFGGFLPRFCLALIFLNGLLFFSSEVHGQRPSFGDSFVIPQGQVAPPVIGVQPGTIPPPTLPQTTLPPTTPTYQSPYPQTVPLPPVVTTPAPSLVQPPTVDPTVGNTNTLPPIVPSVPQQSTQPPGYIYPPPGAIQPTAPGWQDNITTWPSQAWASLQTTSSNFYRQERFSWFRP